MENNIQEVFDSHDLKNIDDISVEYGRLFDWFEGEYVGGRINLEVNNDRTKGTGLLKFKLSVTSPPFEGPKGKDTHHFTNTITLDREKFTNPTWIDGFKSKVFPFYKESITNSMNTYYQKVKEGQNVL